MTILGINIGRKENTITINANDTVVYRAWRTGEFVRIAATVTYAYGNCVSVLAQSSDSWARRHDVIHMDDVLMLVKADSGRVYGDSALAIGA